MSHFTTIQTQVRDLEALRDACAELGFELKSKTHCRGYATARRKCAHAILLKGPYDIAVDPAPDGTFGLTTDWWEGHVEREVGPAFGRLIQLYGVHKTIREAAKKRLRLKRENRTDGSIRLTIAMKGGAS